MIESIDETVLDSMGKTELRNYLDSLFEQAMVMVKLSEDWPVISNQQKVTTRRKRFTKNNTSITPPLSPPSSSHLDSNTTPETLQPQQFTSNSGHYYIQRQSVHDDVSYDQLREVLLENHSINEQKYVDMLVEAKELKSFKKKTDTDTSNDNDDGTNAGMYWLGYKANLASPREFVELVATREHLSNNDGQQPRSFLVVSQPVNTTNYSRKSHVRGKYISWEYVCEKRKVDDGGTTQQSNMPVEVEWTCIQQSSAGGWVPGFLSDYVAAKEFHKDVSNLIDYIKNKKQQ